METPACRQDEEEDVERTPAPAGREKETDWKQSGSFLSQLACRTEESEVAALEARSFAVNHQYTVTGFQDSEDGLEAIVSVKTANGHEILLSLEPEIVGRVLGLQFEGLEVPNTLSREEKEQLPVPKGAWKQNRVTHRGFNLSCIGHAQLREYVERRQGEVFCQTRLGISSVDLFCFQEELVKGSQFNWAEKRMKNVRRMLRAQNTPLSVAVKDLLTTYFGAALPLVLEVSDGFHGKSSHQAGSGRRKKKQEFHVRRGLGEEFEKQRPDYGSERQHEGVEAPRRSKRLREQAGEDHMRPEYHEYLEQPRAKLTSREKYPGRHVNFAARGPDAWAGSPQLCAKDELLFKAMNLAELALHLVDRNLRR